MEEKAIDNTQGYQPYSDSELHALANHVGDDTVGRLLATIAARDSERRKRLPDTRSGDTLHFTVTSLKDDDTTLEELKGYAQTGLYDDGRLGEVFIKLGKPGESTALLDQWAIAVSVALQHGADVDGLFEKFRHTKFKPSGATNVPGIPRCSSLVDLVSTWILRKYGKGDAA